jgi:hypothetical protein
MPDLLQSLCWAEGSLLLHLFYYPSYYPLIFSFYYPYLLVPVPSIIPFSTIHAVFASSLLSLPHCFSQNYPFISTSFSYYPALHYSCLYYPPLNLSSYSSLYYPSSLLRYLFSIISLLIVLFDRAIPVGEQPHPSRTYRYKRSYGKTDLSV